MHIVVLLTEFFFHSFLHDSRTLVITWDAIDFLVLRLMSHKGQNFNHGCIYYGSELNGLDLEDEDKMVFIFFG